MINSNIKRIYSKLSTKYNSEPFQYNKFQIENLIKTRSCKISTISKENSILTSFNEYLKRYYTLPEINERIPKYVNYYKNYFKFFCKPTFCHSQLNSIMQKQREKKAVIYYNKKYKNKKQRKSNINNEKVFTNTIKRNINKKSKCYTNNRNNDISKETINLNDDSDLKTMVNHSITKDNSILSILNAFNNGNNNNKKTNTLVVKYCKTNLNVSNPSNAFMLKAKRFNDIQQKKSHIKLKSPVCLMKSEFHNTNTDMKFPLLHIRVQTDSKNIRKNQIKLLSSNNINCKKVFLLTSSTNKTIQQSKQSITSFNFFNMQQTLLNKNRKYLLKKDVDSRNIKLQTNRNMLRTLNSELQKTLKKIAFEKKSLNKGRNMKDNKYNLYNNKLKGNDSLRKM